jgi:hypothetical protein
MIYYVKKLNFSETPVNTLFSRGKNSEKNFCLWEIVPIGHGLPVPKKETAICQATQPNTKAFF